MQFWVCMGITLVCLARTSVAEDPTPTPWPTPFYAVLYQNFSGIIGLMDLYYDWENGRNLHLIKNQYQPIVHDMEFNNGTVLKWSTSSDCRNLDVGVGVLPPTWLKGATYLGTQKEDGFTVNVFTKADFIVYREDVVSKRPVSWTFYTGECTRIGTKTTSVGRQTSVVMTWIAKVQLTSYCSLNYTRKLTSCLCKSKPFLSILSKIRRELRSDLVILLVQDVMFM